MTQIKDTCWALSRDCEYVEVSTLSRGYPHLPDSKRSTFLIVYNCFNLPVTVGYK